MSNRLRNSDDQYSDPALLADQFRIGRSVFFEVELTVADIFSRVSDAFNSISTAAVGLESATIYPGGGSGGGVFGCPSLDQYVLVQSKNGTPTPIKVRTLLSKNKTFFLYNPLTGNYNKLVGTKKFPTELFLFETEKGITFKGSGSHKIIRNTQDVNGQFIFDHVIGTEVLTSKFYSSTKKVDISLQNSIQCHRLGEIEDVLEISLESEFIYTVGTSRCNGILSHNRKDAPE